jgi:hypothetical protein
MLLITGLGTVYELNDDLVLIYYLYRNLKSLSRNDGLYKLLGSILYIIPQMKWILVMALDGTI